MKIARAAILDVDNQNRDRRHKTGALHNKIQTRRNLFIPTVLT